VIGKNSQSVIKYLKPSFVYDVSASAAYAPSAGTATADTDSAAQTGNDEKWGENCDNVQEHTSHVSSGMT
jgi:hypothetical protein